jgi:hypothetical protein
VPGATDYPQTIAAGISNSGTIVGTYNNHGHGFVFSGGTYTTLDFPGANVNSLGGVNDSGQIVGFYTGGAFPSPVSFLWDRGVYTTLSFAATAINDRGDIVGSAGYHGVLLDASGNYTTIDFPGAGGNGTTLTGINDRGQITGYYFDANDIAHGFIATPVPAPPSLALFGVGIATLAAWRWARGAQRR